MLIRTRYLLLAIALALLALPAAAHDYPAPGATGEPPRGESKAAHSWSKSCPANPGRSCCCAGVFALFGASKLAAVDAGSWSRAAALPAGATKFGSSAIPRVATPALVHARPRAPPLPS